MISLVNNDLIKIFGSKVQTNVILAPFTTFKIGGPAEYLIEARSQVELIDILQKSRKLNMPIFVLGGGSNILISDRGIKGLVIKNNSNLITIKGIKGSVHAGLTKRHVYVEAESGVSMNRLIRFSIEQGLSGLEMHLGLPGSVGGAVYMNSKWTKPISYVGDVINQAMIFTPKNEIISVSKDYFRFDYDYSLIQKSKDIVLSVVFGLDADNKDILWQTAEKSMNIRKSTQPQGQFSAGCTFKNITQTQAITASIPNQITSAGFLLDHSGCKGMSVGDAYISDIHANFIINKGKAKSTDVIKLINRAKEQVKKQFGIELEEEIIKAGEL